MSPLASLTCRLGLLALLARRSLADCISFGMDFQSGGSYFQNINSTDPFTFVSEFEGCNNDTANNVLVDPNGNQYLCTDTPLTPDDTPEMSTCPIDKDQLFTGPWSVLILSNNGDGDPIAYERDFSLTVGPQSTSTYTPTVTATAVITPVVNATSTTTSTTTTTLVAVTVTSPSTTIKPTTTVTPSQVTVTSTDTLLTLKFTKYSLSIVKTTKTVTATCITPTRQPHQDPTCRITPTVVTAAAMQTHKAKPVFRRVADKAAPFEMSKYLKERRERLEKARSLDESLGRRAPDPQPLVVTDTVTSDWTTTTSTSTAPATTVTYTTSTVVTSTVTPAPVTVLSGKATASVVTVTAPTPTKTKTKYTVATSYTTSTKTTTVVITTKTTPASVKTACRKAGGTLH
ncbi:hypothetical protein AOQ84DRAFT_411292 [Glonium stellatum]|uniref:Uncharacterized protein n=1 Tax=Glonium stellatum TaxID=574774 RepID=A0A8E2JY84_9PEZI|nr:hypothetical protein AOQ84DRAFT_411292 [Glonium stellatum]